MTLSVILVRVYDIKERRQTLYEIANRKLPYGFDMVVMEEGDIYLSGGRFYGYRRAMNNFFKLNFYPKLTKAYFMHLDDLPEMAFPRVWHAMIAFNANTLFSIAGCESKGTVEFYRISDSKWYEAPDVNCNRERHTACPFNGKYIYMFLGRLPAQSEFCKTIERLNVDLMSNWEILDIEGKGVEWAGGVHAACSQISPNEILLFGSYVSQQEQESQRCYKLSLQDRTFNIEQSELPVAVSFKYIKPIWNKGLLITSYWNGALVYSAFCKEWRQAVHLWRQYFLLTIDTFKNVQMVR